MKSLELRKNLLDSYLIICRTRCTTNKNGSLNYCFWMDDYNGYTDKIYEAGLYSLEEAKKVASNNPKAENIYINFYSFTQGLVNNAKNL